MKFKNTLMHKHVLYRTPYIAYCTKMCLKVQKSLSQVSASWPREKTQWVKCS